jgi:hypothetical protein
LLESSEKVLNELLKTSQIQEVSALLLLHPDLHKRNVFISESDLEVSGLIDWQFAAITPTFSYTQDAPGFPFFHDHIDNLVINELGENGDKAARKERSKKALQRVQLYQKMFTTCVRGWIDSETVASTADRSNATPTISILRYLVAGYCSGALRGAYRYF